MRWLITLLLLVLVLAGATLAIFPERVFRVFGKAPAEVPLSPSEVVLRDTLKPADITKIEITLPGKGAKRPTLILFKEGKEWKQPGGWPVREKEVTELVDVVSHLRTRYLPVPIEPAEGWKPFGLDDPEKSIQVVVHGSGKAVTLQFGQPEAKGNEPITARPAYVRIDNSQDVLKIGSDVLAVVSRPLEDYRRRQLFLDTSRVKLSGSIARTALAGERTAEIQITGPDGTFKLKRTNPTPAPRRDPDERTQEPTLSPNAVAEVWELVEPVRDRVEPGKLRTILAAVPDLWVDGFSDKTDLAETGLDKPERTVSVTDAAGKTATLRIGKVALTKTRKEPGMPMGQFPPMPRIVEENFHYAKFDGNDSIFLVKAERFPDLFAKVDDLRDTNLARFEPGDVQTVTVSAKGQPPLTLTKKKGNKEAEREEDKQDRWYVGDRLAEAAKVTELVELLSRLDAKTPADRVDGADAAKIKELGLEPTEATRVTVVSQGKSAEGDPALPVKTSVFVVGKADELKKKLAVLVEGWPRVNLVEDSAAKNINRTALAYRSRRLFDTAEVTLAKATVMKTGGETFALISKPEKKWALTQPIAVDLDEEKSAKLTGELSRLEVVEFVDDNPKPEDLAGRFGLAMPKFVVDLDFTGPGAKPAKLDIGAVKDGGTEYYARLNGTGSVFTVSKALVDSLDRGSLDLLPLALWTSAPDKVTAVAIQRGDEKYTLTFDKTWKLSGPFDAPASAADAMGLAGGLAAVKAEKYDAYTADPAKHGLDKPALKLTVTVLEPKPGSTTKPPVEVPVTRTLLIGSTVTDNPQTRYAKLEGSPNSAVFTISEGAFKAADKAALVWLNRELLTQNPGSIARIEIQGPNKDAVTLVKDDKGNWKPEGATFPLDKPILGNLVFNAANPPILRLAAYGPNVKWADYGLETPAYTITTSTAGEKPEKHVLQLGKEEPTGERYLRIDNGPAVGVVSGAANAALARGKLDLIERTLLTFDPQQLTAITRKAGMNEFELSQAGLNWEVTKPQKFKADAISVEELVGQLAMLRATKIAAFAPADLKPFGLDTPAAVFTLKVGIEKPEDKVLKLGKPVEDGKPNGPRYALIETKGEATVGILPDFLVTRLLQEPIRFKDKTLAKFVDADKVTIERGDRKATFAKINGTWKLTEPLAADAEQADLDELVNAAAKLRADDILAEKPADLKTFGLDTPQATVRFFAGDKEVLAVLVGAKEKDGQRLQGKLEKGDLVVAFEPAMGAKLLGEYRKRAVWSGVDASQIQSLAVSSENSNFEMRKSGPAWLDLAKPEDVYDGAKVTETLATLAGLKAERYVADKDANLKLYGLDKPKRVIVLSQQGGVRKTLQIGGEVGGTGGKQVYARVDEPGRTDVFVIGEGDTAILARDRAAYLIKK